MRYFSLLNCVALFFFLSGAFLLPGKYAFWPEFHQSASAGFLAFCFSIYFLFKKEIKINYYSLVVLLFCLVLVLDIFTRETSFFAFSYYGLLYLLVAFFVGIFSVNYGSEEIKVTLLISVVFIALSSFLLQIYQVSGWWVDYQLLVNYFSEGDNRSYANIGQPNLLGTFYVVAIISLLCLHSKYLINKYIYILLIAIFSVGIYLTASRVAMLSLVTIAVFVFYQNKFKLNIYTLALPFSGAVIFLAKILIPMLFETSDRRLIVENISSGRFEIWRVALEAIRKEWLNGYGFNRTGLASFIEAEKFKGLTNTFVTQSHNIFLDIFIWFGVIVGAFLSIVIIFFVIYYIRDNLKSDGVDYLFLLCFPVIIHSFFEYPLYYLNFIVLFSFVVGLNCNLKNLKINVLPIRVLSLIFMAFSFQCFYEMKKLEVALLDQNLYVNRIYGAENQKPKRIIYADLIEEHINIIGHRDENLINDELINRMEIFSTYYIVPRNIYLIVNYYKDKKNKEMFEFWRLRAINLLPKKYSKYYEDIIYLD